MRHGHCPRQEAQGPGWPKLHYSERRSAESHYAYDCSDCSGEVAASHAGARLRYVTL